MNSKPLCARDPVSYSAKAVVELAENNPSQ